MPSQSFFLGVLLSQHTLEVLLSQLLVQGLEVPSQFLLHEGLLSKHPLEVLLSQMWCWGALLSETCQLGTLEGTGPYAAFISYIL